MSVVSNTLIGHASGSIGNATFSTWKGKNVLKSKATSVANPKTPGQLQQRMAFTKLLILFRFIPAIIKAGFKKLAVGKSEYNAFMAYNSVNAINRSTPGVATVIAANLKVAKGTIATTAIVAPTRSRAANVIDASWSYASLAPGQSLSDKAILVAFNTTQNKVVGIEGFNIRGNGDTGVAMPTDWAVGDSVTTYLAFYNALSGESSDSVNVTGNIVS